MESYKVYWSDGREIKCQNPAELIFNRSIGNSGLEKLSLSRLIERIIQLNMNSIQWSYKNIKDCKLKKRSYEHCTKNI